METEHIIVENTYEISRFEIIKNFMIKVGFFTTFIFFYFLYRRFILPWFRQFDISNLKTWFPFNLESKWWLNFDILRIETWF